MTAGSCSDAESWWLQLTFAHYGVGVRAVVVYCSPGANVHALRLLHPPLHVISLLRLQEH